MAETYSVEAYLRATGADQFSRAFQNAGRDVQGLERSSGAASVTVGGMLKALAGTAAAVAGINMLKNSLDGAISRYDTLNTFPRVLELMGFDAASSAEAIQLLSKGIDGLPTTLDDVAKTTQRIAGMTGDLDGAVETTLALNNAFLASGSSGGDASRGLTQYVQMLAKGKVDMMSWRTLQETMPMALMRTAEAFGYTGASAQNDLYDALQAGDVTFDQFNKKIVELSNVTGGFADMAVESSSGIRTSWTNMKTTIVRNVANMIGAIDQALGGVGSIAGIIDKMKAQIQKAFEYVIANVPRVFSTLQQIAEAIRPWLPLILGIAAAFLTFNTIIATIIKLKAAIVAVKVAFAALKVVMLANPFVVVIAILAGLAVALYMLYQRSETVRSGIDAAFAYIKQVVSQVVAFLSAYVMQVWGAMVAWWNENNESILQKAQSVWTTVQSFIQTAVQAVVTFVMAIWSTLTAFWERNGTSILNSAQSVWTFIQKYIQIAVTAVVSFVMSIWATLTAFWQEHGAMIMEAAQNVWNVIKTVITTAATIIWNVIKVMASVISSVMQFLWPFILMLIESVWNNIKGVIQGAIAVITGIIQFFSALFTGNWSAMWDAVKQIVVGAVQLLWNLIQLWFVGKILKVGATFAKAFGSGIKSMWETIRIIFMYAVDFVKSFVLRGFTGIRTGVTGIMNGIKSVISTVWNAIKSFIGGILNGIRGVFTSIFNAIRNVVTSVFNGIRNIVSSVMNAIRSFISNILNGVRNTVSNILNNIRSRFMSIFNALRGIVTSAFNAVKSAVQSGMNKAWTTVTGFVSKFREAGRNIVTSIANGITSAIGKVTGAIGNVTQKIRDYLPFSPAKEGALRDIMKIKVGESIAQAIDNGRGAAVNSMASLARAVQSEMPNASIATDIGAVHRNSKKQMQFDYQNELTINKQPARITVVLGNQEFERFVEDINEVNTVNDLARRF